MSRAATLAATLLIALSLICPSGVLANQSVSGLVLLADSGKGKNKGYKDSGGKKGQGPKKNEYHGKQGGPHKDKGRGGKNDNGGYYQQGHDDGRHWYDDDAYKRYGKFRHMEPSRDSRGIIISSGLRPFDIRPLILSYGLIGYQPLPPGIRKNLMRGKPLPPGIAKKMVPKPLLYDLPAYPGYEWMVVGSDLVLLALSTKVVVDILSDVFD